MREDFRTISNSNVRLIKPRSPFVSSPYTDMFKGLSNISKTPFKGIVGLTSFSKLFSYSWFRPLVLLVVALLMILLGNDSSLQNSLANGLLIVGLVVVGIPHGAIDHLLDTGNWEFKKAPVFILKYLSLSALMGAIWFFFPPLALLVFLAFSSWHFGQTDGKQWNFSPVISFAWGCSVLFYIMGTHLSESNSILLSMASIALPVHCPVWAMLPWLLWAIYRKQSSLVLTVVWLMLSSQVSLLLAFGLYFIGQHSLTGWQHLHSHLKLSHKTIWLHSVPFHVGAWLLMALFFYLWPTLKVSNDFNFWSLFFIFTACLSFPHTINMNTIYRGKTNNI